MDVVFIATSFSSPASEPDFESDQCDGWVDLNRYGDVEHTGAEWRCTRGTVEWQSCRCDSAVQRDGCARGDERNFFVNTIPVAVSTPVSISASLGGTQSATLTVNPPAITSITLTPTSVMGGAANSTGKVTLNGAAPAGGATVNLSSNNTLAVTVPITVTVAAGSTTATFTVTTFEVGKSITVSISAQLGGTATAVLSVAPCQAGHQCTPPPGCVVNAKGVFLNSAFGLQTANFTAQYDATPSQNNLDNVVGLSNGPASRYEDLAIITRFNSSGFIDARNGANYAATSSVRYSGSQTYHFRVVVHFATHTYDAYVHLSGATPEVQIASNFAFRSEVGTTSQLSNWSTTAEIGDQMVCNFVIGPAAPPPPCIQSSHSAWQGTGFASVHVQRQADDERRGIEFIHERDEPRRVLGEFRAPDRVQRRRDPPLDVGKREADGLAAEIGADEPLTGADAKRQTIEFQNFRRHRAPFNT